MTIDFKEIPLANTGTGLQDTFELFSRDCLEDIGFEIVQHPSRGADGKKDLIVSENRNGLVGKTTIRWLVSCKHYAHSGKAVSDTDEPDIVDRVLAHQCNGFIGMYSTLAATSLSNKLEGCSSKIEHQIFDRARIEKHLLNHNLGIKLARRYFPVSIKKYLLESRGPATIFETPPEIKCDHCGQNLLSTKNGIYVFLGRENSIKSSKSGREYWDWEDIYFSCKGICDTIMENKSRERDLWSAGWEDINDLMIPTLFLRNFIGYMNQLADQDIVPAVHKKIISLYLNTFPHISRELTDDETRIVKLHTQFDI